MVHVRSLKLNFEDPGRIPCHILYKFRVRGAQAGYIAGNGVGALSVHTSFQGFPLTAQILALLDPSHVLIPPDLLTPSFALSRSSSADLSSSTSEGKSALYLTNTPPSFKLFPIQYHYTSLACWLTNRGSISRTSNSFVCTFFRVSDNWRTSFSC